MLHILIVCCVTGISAEVVGATSSESFLTVIWEMFERPHVIVGIETSE